MALAHIPGDAPEVLTVAASPAPTDTIFTVSDGTNLVASQWINVEVGGTFERGKILTVVGDVVTLVSALSGAPDTPGEVRNTRELITISDTQKLGVYNALTVDDVSGGDMTYLPAGTKIHVPEVGLYRLSTATGITPDGKYAIDATNSTNEHLLEVLGTEAVEELIETHTGALQAQIDDLQLALDTLTDQPSGAVAVRTWIINQTLTFGAIAATTDSDGFAAVAPGFIPDLRATDAITVTPPRLPAGIALIGWWAHGNSVAIRLRNTSAGSVTVAAGVFTIKIERPVE